MCKRKVVKQVMFGDYGIARAHILVPENVQKKYHCSLKVICVCEKFQYNTSHSKKMLSVIELCTIPGES